MAKQNPAAGHQPLSYRDRLRLNAAIKHLKSRFHSVRIAAHKEIQAILHKKRGVQRRLREWVAKTTRTAARKVTPKPLHKALRVQKAASVQARAKGTPAPLVKDMPAHGLRAPGGFGQTTEDLKERTRAAHRAARGKDPQAPAQQPQRGTPQPARMTAGRESLLSRMTRPRPVPASGHMPAERPPGTPSRRPVPFPSAPPLPADLTRQPRMSRLRDRSNS